MLVHFCVTVIATESFDDFKEIWQNWVAFRALPLALKKSFKYPEAILYTIYNKILSDLGTRKTFKLKKYLSLGEVLYNCQYACSRVTKRERVALSVNGKQPNQ